MAKKNANNRNKMASIARKPRLLASTPTHDFCEVKGDVFGDCVAQAITKHEFHRINLAAHPEGYGKFSCWMQSDNNAGYAVSRLPVLDTGHRELINVFSTVSGVGNGERLVRHAQKTYGQLSLDCYDGVLVEFYSRFGFRESERKPNWTKGGPDIVFMRFDR